MGEKKYMLHPGWVESKTDGDRHHISAQRLVDLYGVSWDECVIYSGHNPGMKEWAGFIHLRPRYDGNYSLERLL